MPCKERAAPSESPADSPLQGRTPLNELSKSPKPVSLKYVLPITYINTYIYIQVFPHPEPFKQPRLTAFSNAFEVLSRGITMYKYKYLYIYGFG